MKWLTTTIVVALALATNSCVKGQDVINFVSDQEEANGIRGQQQQMKSSRFKFENEKVLAASTPSLLPKKALVEKAESVGVLSNDKEQESITFVNPQDETVLSVRHVEDTPQVQAQGRELITIDEFNGQCTQGYVDCVGGQEVDPDGNPTGQTCAIACGGLCCVGGTFACVGFTGKVCKDGSCIGNGVGFACLGATIPYVVGQSCTGAASCQSAQIRSVVSSCKADFSCQNAALSGVDLNNSCKKVQSCQRARANGAFAELTRCCNGINRQCLEKVGNGIVGAGGPNCLASTNSPTGSPSKEPTSSPSRSPSQGPSGSPSSSPTKADTDGDGVFDDEDECLGTYFDVPEIKLKPNHFVLGSDGINFIKGESKGKGKGTNMGPFTIQDTRGCSCKQIIEKLSLGNGHRKFGCSPGVMDCWVNDNCDDDLFDRNLRG